MSVIYLIIVSSSRTTSQGLSAALGSEADLLIMACSLAQCPETRVQITQENTAATMNVSLVEGLDSIVSNMTSVDI